MPTHANVLSCSLVSKEWYSVCRDSQVWKQLFFKRAKDSWNLVDDYEQVWDRIMGNVAKNEVDQGAQKYSLSSPSPSPAKRRDRGAVRVDDDPLRSSTSSRFADTSMRSVEAELTRTRLVDELNNVTDSIDWFKVYQARFFLSRRWAIQDGEPEAAVLEDRSSSLASSQEARAYSDGSFSFSEDQLLAQLQKPRSSAATLRKFNPTDKHLVGHTDSVYCLRFDHQPFKLPLNVEKSLQEEYLKGPLYDPATSLGLGSYGKIITGSRDRTIRIWDGDSGMCLHTLEGHDASVLGVEYDDRHLFSVSSDSTVIVWDLAVMQKGLAPTAIRRIRGHSAGVLDLAINTDWLLTCGKDYNVRVYDRRQDFRLIHIYAQHDGPVNGGALHHNSETGKTRAVTVSGEGGIHLWDVESGTLIRTFVGHTKGLACVKLVGHRMVTGSNDTTVRVWDIETGDCLCVCKGHDKLVRSVGFDPNRPLILSGGYDGLIKVFNLGSELHPEAVLASDGGLVEEALWSIDAGHERRIFDVQMDTTRIICCGEDAMICVRDFGLGSPLMRLFV